MAQRTPLFDKHVALGARMTEFGGWDMPVWYSGIQEEHSAVRTGAGLSDVSHMGEFVVHGPGALDFLRRVLSNDPALLAVNQAQYTLLPNERGGTVDDLLCYKLDERVYLLVVNASNIEKDFNWLESLREPSAELDDRSPDKALLALQGPEAVAILAPLTDVPARAMEYYHFDRGDVAGIPSLVSRTGYTGEDGFEIMVDAEDAPDLWDRLIEAGSEKGLVPCGLGARDTLRLEAAFPLYGHELDDETSGIEAGLAFCIKLDKPGMVGAARLRRDKEDGPAKKLVGLTVTERGIPRQGHPIVHDGSPVGVVTSGTMSPTLEEPIALGYVPPELAPVGSELAIRIRERDVAARVVKRPFYRRPSP
jgi:aminomethyltransferase